GQFSNRQPFALTAYNALVGLSGSGSNVSRRAVEAYLPIPETFLPRELRTDFESLEEALAYDHGFTRVSPPTGSTLVSHMQRTVRVVTGEHPTKLDADGLPAKTFETVSVPVPRVHATYAEGESLLGALNKSASASSNGAGLQPLYLDAFVGDELRADVSDKTARPPVPQGSYGLGLDAYSRRRSSARPWRAPPASPSDSGTRRSSRPSAPSGSSTPCAPWPRVRASPGRRW
ncbi:hypothetical protein, partial [Streptomyces roseofulvus]|uniref:hypothetical protein n=1 Tax=Streptomyces roseofulvus TaxID=33902 RepID=UPI0031FDD6AD